MDDTRSLLIACCASLSRLQLRLQDQLASKQYLANGTVNSYPVWTVASLDPPSAWLADLSPHMALGGALRAVTLVMAHLLAMVDLPGPVDAKRACVVLQALGSIGWSDPVLRLASQLRVTLPATPMDGSNGVALSESSIPRR